MIHSLKETPETQERRARLRRELEREPYAWELHPRDFCQRCKSRYADIHFHGPPCQCRRRG